MADTPGPDGTSNSTSTIRWWSRPFSNDSIVALVSVIVAIPAAYVVAADFGEAVFFPVLVTVATGPAFALRKIKEFDPQLPDTIGWSVLVAITYLTAFVVLFLAGRALGLSTRDSGAASFVLTFLGGNIIANALEGELF